MFAIPEDKNRFAFSKWMAISTALLSLLLILWITNNDTTPASQSGATDTVFEADIKQTVVAFGQLKPKLRQGVIAMTAGNIAEIRVKSGDYVEKNQVLFRLINTQVESDLANRKLLLLQEKAHCNKLTRSWDKKLPISKPLSIWPQLNSMFNVPSSKLTCNSCKKTLFQR